MTAARNSSGRGYAANLVASWIPSLDAVEEKLERGIRVAGFGCGKGASTYLMAQAFPKSRLFGFDHHGKSIEGARESAKREGVADRIALRSSTLAARLLRRMAAMRLCSDYFANLGALPRTNSVLDQAIATSTIVELAIPQ